jgi:DNA repair exonuclease SbcCD nuclease subunit
VICIEGVSFRFIHTGDIHLDSPLKGLSGQQGAAAERIRTATRVALDNLVSLAIEDEVDFVIIAGDLYDGDWRDYQTGLFFVKQMGGRKPQNSLKIQLRPNASA